VASEEAKLNQLRRLQRSAWIWLVTILPAALIAWLMPRPSLALGAVAILWASGLAISVIRASFMQCPRCGERFHGKRIFPIGRACAACGLRLKQRRVVYPTLE